MLQNSLTRISTQAPISLPAVGLRRHEGPPALVGSSHRRLPPPQAAAATGAPILVVDNKNGGGKGMTWFYELEEEVREYELDQFGVVNNAIYSNFCEYGTYKLLDEIGFDAHIKLAVHEVAIKYIAPLKRKDKYLLRLRIRDYSTTRLYFEDQIVKLPNHELILTATATLVLLDEKLRPSRITPSMISKFNQFLQSNTNNCCIAK